MHHIGNCLLAFAAHAGPGGVLQAGREHHHPRAGCAGDAVEVIGKNPLAVQGNAVQGQA
ncbi:hypothetical protein D3C84_669790 [compost metagenome]